ncbi:M20/M25/M40 family metallo-hydrolase [Solitalea koreensis]|uniref:Carboxypeptidase Q n=1 Tax=Solitalea koreensis TaxID=543615 RepID=A0A521CJ48_9SPHI|nr:M20/M25/M40 family metallo-hydrolase [Solitalea koreensis]SMO58720.1 Peptidase family M28 [Solitalea koreensis]
MKKILVPALIFTFFTGIVQAQTDSAVVKSIFTNILTEGKVYDNLTYLCTKIGPRLSGSANAQKAVEWTKKVMEEQGFDRVFLQEVMVPHWLRGAKETAWFNAGSGKQSVVIAALGGSIATPKDGVEAEVVEVNSYDQLKVLGEAQIKGKFVFLNRPMNPANVDISESYGEVASMRNTGASEAAKYGAVGVIFRSITTLINEYPHTGAMGYTSENKIPAAAICTRDAELLSKQLKANPKLKFYYKMNCQTLPDVQSYNVVAEIKGSEFPDQYIVVGGHLDSWDLAQGAQDDGAGVMQSIEVLRTIKALGIKPKHTIRAVLFINEENGARGGLKYAELAKQNNEHHLVAIESDAGGFTPRGFDIDGPSAVLTKVLSWKALLDAYGLSQIKLSGHAGTDIGPLKPMATALIGFRPDPQRYFDFHHAANDVIGNVNERELKLGAASMTMLVYLMDKYGLKEVSQ